MATHNVAMEHKFKPLPDGSLLVLAADGPARVMPDGSAKWKTEWDWKIGAIRFKPAVTKNGLIYQYKNKLTYFSVEDGSMIWQTRESQKADYLITKQEDKIFIIEDKRIACHRI